MKTTAILTICCPNKAGLVSAITTVLREMGANLLNIRLSALGGGPAFSAICGLSGRVASSDCRRCLRFDGHQHVGSAQIDFYGGWILNEASS